MNKEDRNQFLLPVPSWIARFIPNLHLTPQGLLSKPGKNDRLIWDGSFIPNWSATSINIMLSHTSFKLYCIGIKARMFDNLQIFTV